MFATKKKVKLGLTGWATTEQLTSADSSAVIERRGTTKPNCSRCVTPTSNLNCYACTTRSMIRSWFQGAVYSSALPQNYL